MPVLLFKGILQTLSQCTSMGTAGGPVTNHALSEVLDAGSLGDGRPEDSVMSTDIGELQGERIQSFSATAWAVVGAVFLWRPFSKRCATCSLFLSLVLAV